MEVQVPKTLICECTPFSVLMPLSPYLHLLHFDTHNECLLNNYLCILDGEDDDLTCRLVEVGAGVEDRESKGEEWRR